MKEKTPEEIMECFEYALSAIRDDSLANPCSQVYKILIELLGNQNALTSDYFLDFIHKHLTTKSGYQRLYINGDMYFRNPNEFMKLDVKVQKMICYNYFLERIYRKRSISNVGDACLKKYMENLTYLSKNNYIIGTPYQKELTEGQTSMFVLLRYIVERIYQDPPYALFEYLKLNDMYKYFIPKISEELGYMLFSTSNAKEILSMVTSTMPSNTIEYPLEYLLTNSKCFLTDDEISDIMKATLCKNSFIPNMDQYAEFHEILLDSFPSHVSTYLNRLKRFYKDHLNEKKVRNYFGKLIIDFYFAGAPSFAEYNIFKEIHKYEFMCAEEMCSNDIGIKNAKYYDDLSNFEEHALLGATKNTLQKFQTLKDNPNEDNLTMIFFGNKVDRRTEIIEAVKSYSKEELMPYRDVILNLIKKEKAPELLYYIATKIHNGTFEDLIDLFRDKLEINLKDYVLGVYVANNLSYDEISLSLSFISGISEIAQIGFITSTLNEYYGVKVKFSNVCSFKRFYFNGCPGEIYFTILSFWLHMTHSHGPIGYKDMCASIPDKYAIVRRSRVYSRDPEDAETRDDTIKEFRRSIANDISCDMKLSGMDLFFDPQHEKLVANFIKENFLDAVFNGDFVSRALTCTYNTEGSKAEFFKNYIEKLYISDTVEYLSTIIDIDKSKYDPQILLDEIDDKKVLFDLSDHTAS